MPRRKSRSDDGEDYYPTKHITKRKQQKSHNSSKSSSRTSAKSPANTQNSATSQSSAERQRRYRQRKSFDTDQPNLRLHRNVCEHPESSTEDQPSSIYATIPTMPTESETTYATIPSGSESNVCEPPNSANNTPRRKQIQRESDPAEITEAQDLCEPAPIPAIASEIQPPLSLGPRSNICPFCDAIHFRGKRICCDDGKVFIHPYRKLPEYLRSLFFDFESSESKHFHKHILQYNALFQFASTQYDKAAIPDYTPPIAKVNGVVRNFPSCVLPNDPHRKRFGNLFVLDTDDAIQERLKHPFMKVLQNDMVEKLQLIMEKHPMAKMYYSLHQRMKEDQRQGLNPEMLRVKIVSPFDPISKELQTHPSTYVQNGATPNRDYVLIFFDATVDREILPPGLIIYPKLGRSTPRPIHYWRPEIDTLAYPLLFPYGELGYDRRAHFLTTPELFQERIRKFQHDNPNYELDSESSNSNSLRSESSPESLREESDSSCDLADLCTTRSSISDSQLNENIDDDPYDTSLNHYIATREKSSQLPCLKFVERNGQRYPIRLPVESRQHDSTQAEDLFTDDSGDDLNVEMEVNSTEDHSIIESDAINDLVSDETPACQFVQSDRANENLVEEDEETDIVENSIPNKKRVFVSSRQHMRYLLQDRKRFKNRFRGGGKLAQLNIIDRYLRIMQSQMKFIQQHYTEYCTSTKKKVLKAYEKMAEKRNRRIGAITTLPSKVAGSPRYLRRRYENSVAVANKLGKPDLFITFTCICGKADWYTYSVEFQRSGLPHMHLLVGLHNKIKTSAQVDAICKAVIPKVDPNDPSSSRMNFLVTRFMVHTPCEGNDSAYCNEGRKPYWTSCRKRFPKQFRDHTEIGDRNYPELARPDDGQICLKKRTESHGTRKKQVEVIADNRYVVPYNPYLLSKYEAHVNVEIVSSILFSKYIFKYLFKGFDRALVQCFDNIDAGGGQLEGELTVSSHIIHPKRLHLPAGAIQTRNQEAVDLLARQNIPSKDQNGAPMLVFNECHTVMDMAATTATEAAYHIEGYPRTGCSHEVFTTFVHAPDEEPMRIDLDKELEAIEKASNDNVNSQLKAWFSLNCQDDEHGELARTLTFDQIPLHFSYNAKKGCWKFRTRTRKHFTIGKIKQVNPRYLKTFAIRLLCLHQRGPRSFQDLRTYNGTCYETFEEAARAMRLMNCEEEWDSALKEASQTQMPAALRRMFVTILLYCAPKNPRKLFEDNKESFYQNKTWTNERNLAHTLYHIQSGLRAHGTALDDYNLPNICVKDLPPPNELYDDDTETNIATELSAKIANEMQAKLTKEQRAIFHKILDSIEKGERQSFFLDAPGGCGKTFLYKTLYYTLRGMNKKVLCVAHTGVAAGLLPNGMTVHRAFGIPLDISDNMTSRISLESDNGRSSAEYLRSLDVVLWDEACMTERRIYEAVDKLFQYLHEDEMQQKVFGGTTFIMGGDWRQTLPIVNGVHGEAAANYTLKKSSYWNELVHIKLENNQRAKTDTEYADWVKQIGDGSNFDSDNDNITIPSKILMPTEKSVIQHIFGYNKLEDESYVTDACILTVDNVTSLDLNEQILKMKQGIAHCYNSRDEHDPNHGFLSLNPEIYNSLTPPGMPPHKLNLKIGAIVILLRNLNVNMGLVNGLRMRIVKLGIDTIECEPVSNYPKVPKSIIIHRIALSPSVVDCRDIAFVRWQYPIRLAYSMTINKSQGQTLGKVGLILRTPVFSHGQLYVALSRVRSFNDIRIVNLTSKTSHKLRNVVYRSILTKSSVSDQLESLPSIASEGRAHEHTLRTVCTEEPSFSQEPFCRQISARKSTKRRGTPNNIPAAKSSKSSVETKRTAATLTSELEKNRYLHLENPNGTFCFANAVIQCLRHLSIRTAIIDLGSDPVGLSGLIDLMRAEGRANVHGFLQSCSTGGYNYLDGRHHDANEILGYIIEHLPTRFADLFAVQYVQKLTCTNRECEKITHQKQLMFMIKTEIEPIGAKLSLTQLINNTSTVETIQKDCDQCKILNSAHLIEDQYEVPSCCMFLTVLIQLFVPDKNNSLVRSQYQLHDCSDQNIHLFGRQWKVAAVISHLGTSFVQGHYISYVRSENAWMKCNDEQISEVDKPDFSTASMILLERQ